MNKFENFKSMTMDELVDWLDEHGSHDTAPWMYHFDRNYCSKCEPVDAGWAKDYAWCELNGKCRYFQEMNDIPDHKQTIKMWLESENE